MARKSDRELGLGRDISRRDFIHDVSLASLGLSLPMSAWAGVATADPDVAGAYYPPTRTGLRGSHPGSFEVAHALAREGKAFDAPLDLDEAYDLVVVGGGLSGLAAAYFHRKLHGPEARILVLDNHDDFGGHAKRNEFHHDGQMRLAWGGTVNMEYPKYSPVAMGLITELGIDIPRLLREGQFKWESDEGKGRFGMLFDAEHFGRDVFLPGVSFERMSPGELAASLDGFPIADGSRAALRRFLLFEGDVLAGRSEADKARYLSSTAYTAFLAEHFAMPDEVLRLMVNLTMGYWGVPADNLSVTECMDSGLPGRRAVGGIDVHAEEANAPGQDSAMFPDGNSSIARLLVRALVPAALPDLAADADPLDISTARLVYEQLDQPSAPVRLRLNSTVVQVENRDDGVAVSYVRDGKVLRLRARQAVLACYNNIIPHLCPSLPEAQKLALKQCIRRPMLIINVQLRNGEAIARSGILGASTPTRLCQFVRLVDGVNSGAYHPQWRPEEACVMNFYAGVAAPQPEGLDMIQRHQAARARLLGMSFEDFEREVRTVLDALYAEHGFSAADDILAIMVNRWPHGYARDHLDLEDPAWNADPPPHVVGRAKFGNIAIANSDAGADAYTHIAIDQAWRAVNELAG